MNWTTFPTPLFQLLATVEASTGDVSGLHEKLDRKKAVEQHNAEVQQDFAGRMQADFNQMQKSIEEQSARHQGMLSLYSGSVGEFALPLSSRWLRTLC